MSILSTINAAGSIMSGLGGMFGSKGKRTDPINQAREMHMLNREAAEDLAKDLPLAQKIGFERAGIHPVYGFSGGAAQYSPSISVGDFGQGTTGHALSQMGNGISRAAEAMIAERERLQNRFMESQIVGSDIDNQKKASDLVMSTMGVPPGLGAVSQSPVEMFTRQPNTGRSVEAGDIADVAFSVGKRGARYPMPSEQAADRMDVEAGLWPNIGAVLWDIRNRVAPNFGGGNPPSQDQLPKGYKWGWSMAKQGWIPVKTSANKPRFRSSKGR